MRTLHRLNPVSSSFKINTYCGNIERRAACSAQDFLGIRRCGVKRLGDADHWDSQFMVQVSTQAWNVRPQPNIPIDDDYISRGPSFRTPSKHGISRL